MKAIPAIVVLTFLACLGIGVWQVHKESQNSEIRWEPAIETGTVLTSRYDTTQQKGELIKAEAILIGPWSSDLPRYRWKIGVPGRPIRASQYYGQNSSLATGWYVEVETKQGLELYSFNWVEMPIGFLSPAGQMEETPPTMAPIFYEYHFNGTETTAPDYRNARRVIRR